MMYWQQFLDLDAVCTWLSRQYYCYEASWQSCHKYNCCMVNKK